MPDQGPIFPTSGGGKGGKGYEDHYGGKKGGGYEPYGKGKGKGGKKGEKGGKHGFPSDHGGHHVCTPQIFLNNYTNLLILRFLVSLA